MQTHAWSWSQLLALRLAAGTKQHDLALWLLTHAVSPGSEPPWPVSAAAQQHARRQADALVDLGISLVPVWRLPAVFHALRPLPPALYVRGDARLLHRAGVGIVGSRLASPDAIAWTQRFATRQARLGHLVVSGGALGIDSAAHQGALAAGTPTLAYIGTCVDRPYPARNLPLFTHIIAAGGALVSEHPPLDITYKSGHALRNRFIAAHAAQLTVVEAAEASGTLGTAMWARRLGTPVFVSPDGVGNARAGLCGLLDRGYAQQHPH